jgi:aryl-alcohol dehydrogenase-like predicted oxidoreductase
MAQLAMAWVVANPDVSTALTGASRVEQLKDIIKSLDIVPKLTADVQKRI